MAYTKIHAITTTVDKSVMRAKGYEIKGETFGKDAPKFISFRPLGKDRFMRDSVKSLGKEYTKERIEMKRERKAVIPKRDYASRKLVDTTDEKFQRAYEEKSVNIDLL